MLSYVTSILFHLIFVMQKFNVRKRSFPLVIIMYQFNLHVLTFRAINLINFYFHHLARICLDVLLSGSGWYFSFFSILANHAIFFITLLVYYVLRVWIFIEMTSISNLCCNDFKVTSMFPHEIILEERWKVRGAQHDSLWTKRFTEGNGIPLCDPTVP